MKRTGIIAAAALVGIVFLAGSIYAGGNKYTKKPYTPPEEAGNVGAAEAVTSMSDCMTLSSDHKTKGIEADKAEFKRQFGEPISSNGNVFMYKYDNYTNIVLKCRARGCDCMCLSKY